MNDRDKNQKAIITLVDVLNRIEGIIQRLTDVIEGRIVDDDTAQKVITDAVDALDKDEQNG